MWKTIAYWVGGIVLVLAIIKISTRKRGSDNIMDRAKSRMKSLGDCCKRFFTRA